MAAHRSRTNAKARGDVLVIEPIRERLQHLALARCDVGDDAPRSVAVRALLAGQAVERQHFLRTQQCLSGARPTNRRDNVSDASGLVQHAGRAASTARAYACSSPLAVSTQYRETGPDRA